MNLKDFQFMISKPTLQESKYKIDRTILTYLDKKSYPLWTDGWILNVENIRSQKPTC